MTPERVSAKKAELAEWLREGLVRLGPTFIKIGQQFSTRVDVLSPEFIKELEKLQDNVPPFSSETAVRIVERGLGGRVDDIYDEFDRRPIAAASLGQVRCHSSPCILAPPPPNFFGGGVPSIVYFLFFWFVWDVLQCL